MKRIFGWLGLISPLEGPGEMMVMHHVVATPCLFSPAGRSAERSEAMRGWFRTCRTPPSSDLSGHLLPEGRRDHKPNLYSTVASLFVLLALCLFALPTFAAEQILNFHSDIALAKSGLITVTETIAVNAENRDINHGIFRDFPLTRRGEDGKIHEVDFKLLSVTRDGEPEPFSTEAIDNGTRIYAGNADEYVTPGHHTYQFSYETNRQIGYFPEGDQLYWNVTGNFWIFPILKSSATITLPEGVTPDAVRVYTGEAGKTGADAKARWDGSAVQLVATRSFRPGEGMTIQINMPKGAIDPPSQSQERWWWIKDNRNLLISGFGGLLVWLWYGWSWVKVGRDPPRGVMVPRWDAPDGISPALVNYIDNKGFSDGGWKAFSAAALNLAVNGLITLEDLKTSIIMSATGKTGAAKPSTGENAILTRVVSAGGKLTLDTAHGETVKATGAAFVNAIEREQRGKYYNANAAYVVVGVVITVAVFITLFAFGNMSGDAGATVVIPAVVGVVISVFSAVLGRNLQSSSSLIGKVFAILVLGIVGLVAFAVIGGVLVMAVDGLLEEGQLPTMVAIVAIIIANILFFFIMGAPTPLGAKMMDGIDGLRHYLTVAEKDRMNMAGAPQMSPQHFEKLLPYAVALGVEKPWTKTFDTWLESAKMADTYQPSWYSGASYGGFAGSIGGFSSSMASTIQSTLPAPPPSSSSGGGFSGGGSSGGGGGGGGGGGW